MAEDIHLFEQRKKDHIQLALMDDNQAVELHALDNIILHHEALPDIDFNDIDISSTRFGEVSKTPFIVSSMTAGHEHAKRINRNLLEACQARVWAMGVGSQRRELSDKEAHQEWRSLIRDFSDVMIFSNLGIAQLIQTSVDDVLRLMDNINASALIVHLNALQECIQPEGTPQFKGGLNALEQIKKSIKKPLIVKETGCGFSVNTLKRLNDIGVDVIDLSGGGGTHWGRIEGHRSTNHLIQQKTSNTFRNWGVSTLQSLMNAKSVNPGFEIWGSGGIRHGLDAARLLALGASNVAFAKPLLAGALMDAQAVIDTMDTITYELKTAMFCTGSINIQALRESVCQASMN